MDQVTQEVILKLFFLAIIIDFVTGILASAKEGRLKSRSCSDGLFRSIGECIVLIILMVITHFLPTLEFISKTFTICFIFKEALSVIENLTRLGVWIPYSIKATLEDGIKKVDKE